MMVQVSYAGETKLKWMCFDHGPACYMSDRANETKLALYKELADFVSEMVDIASSVDPNAGRLPAEWRSKLVKFVNKIEKSRDA